MISRIPVPRLAWHFLMYFLLLSAYFFLVFDPSLYAHHHQAVFLADWGYFQEFLTYPGGFVEWVTRFFFQFSCFKLAGSFMLAAVSVAILALAYRLLKQLAGLRRPLIFACVPLLLFLVQQSHYSFPLVIGVKYCCSIALLLLYVRLRSRQKKVGFLLSGLGYLALGGWWLLFYSSLCLVHEALYEKGRQRYVHAALSLLAYVAYPFLAARFLFSISLKEAYFYIVPYELYQGPFFFHPNLPLYLFFLSLPLLLLGTSCYVRLSGDRPRGKGWMAGRGGLAAQSAVTTLACLGILTASFDTDEKKMVQVDHLAQQGRWNELLAVSRQISHRTRQATFHTNRALFHTGRLLEEMFSFPQLYGADGLFLNRIGTASHVTVPSSDLYLELGHVKASQVMAYEGQTRQKYSPRLLKRLVLTNIINENSSAAEMFLGVLDRSILHRGWVRRYRSRLADGVGEGGDDFIQSKRSGMPQAEFFISRQNPNQDLMNILREDGGNRMALEYLLAYYLLEGRMGDLLGCLKAIPLGLGEMPRHVEEALILIKATKPEALSGTAFQIRSRTVSRFLEFNRTLARHARSNAEVAAREGGFSDTVWYYGRYINPRHSASKLKTRRIDVDVL